MKRMNERMNDLKNLVSFLFGYWYFNIQKAENFPARILTKYGWVKEKNFILDKEEEEMRAESEIDTLIAEHECDSDAYLISMGLLK